LSPLEVTQEDRVRRLTLNRPDKRNALNTELCSAIVDAVESAGEDPSIGCILLEARGEVFSAGMDLEEASGPDPAARTAIHERLLTLGARARKPIVAAVAGPALGGGLGLVANAHIVVASHGCTFGLTEIRVGMWPFVIWRAMVSALGERRAIALTLTGRIFSVNEALQWGLVHEVAPPFEVDDRATATAHHVASFGSEVVALGMDYLRACRRLAPEESGRLAVEYRSRAFASRDFQEGVAAFREKRKPEWKR
jgi:enoyl-CoA hydratase/carnithine racemase